ncbi:MAG: two-component system, sensor histidine kinase and response regulator [Acidobacteriota bacterium]|nr:two-component system, sensor histidine kinase and response regulator [Acidobacteriota bacterium]
MNELKILVVDDEPGMRMGVERSLRNYRFKLPGFDEEVFFNIRMASTGKEAVEMMELEKPDILLLDHKLPDLQGLDILLDISQKKLDILTIMITAYASLEVAISATKHGAFDFLAKPFTPDELRNAVQKAAKQIFLQRQAQKLAAERRQVRFQFISVLAHELKSPIAAVEGYLRIVDKHMLGDDIGKYDTMIQRSLRRLRGMQKMILDILDLTRIEAGTKNRELTDVNITEVALECIDGVTPDAKDRGVSINLESPENITMHADRGELEIIFNNFMTNAVKYNRDNGRVDVKVQPDEHGVTLVFSDTGIGMTEEEQNRLFGEFVRIKNEKTKDILGSGLGLSIVKKLLAFYDGTVDVKSVPDQGTTFTVRLNKKDEASR